RRRRRWGTPRWRPCARSARSARRRGPSGAARRWPARRPPRRGPGPQPGPRGRGGGGSDAWRASGGREGAGERLEEGDQVGPLLRAQLELLELGGLVGGLPPALVVELDDLREGGHGPVVHVGAGLGHV